MTKHSEHYWEEGRNGWTPSNTWQEQEGDIKKPSIS